MIKFMYFIKTDNNWIDSSENSSIDFYFGLYFYFSVRFIDGTALNAFIL